VLVLCRFLRGLPIILKASSQEIFPALNEPLDRASLLVPDMNCSTKRSSDNVVQIRMKGNLQDLRSVIKALDQTILAKYVPDFDGLVPGATREHSVGWTEAEAGYWASVPTQNVDELPCFQAPNENVEGIVGTSNNDVTSSFDCEASKLS